MDGELRGRQRDQEGCVGRCHEVEYEGRAGLVNWGLLRAGGRVHAGYEGLVGEEGGCKLCASCGWMWRMLRL